MENNGMPSLQFDNDSSAPVIYHGDYSLYPRLKHNSVVFERILKMTLPKVDSTEDSILLTEVLIALQLEGIISKDVTDDEKQMVRTIIDAIKASPEKKEEALILAKKLLK